MKPEEHVVADIRRNGRRWLIVRIGESYFARDERGTDTGPYSTAGGAVEFVELEHQ